MMPANCTKIGEPGQRALPGPHTGLQASQTGRLGCQFPPRLARAPPIRLHRCGAGQRVIGMLCIAANALLRCLRARPRPRGRHILAGQQLLRQLVHPRQLLLLRLEQLAAHPAGALEGTSQCAVGAGSRQRWLPRRRPAEQTHRQACVSCAMVRQQEAPATLQRSGRALAAGPRSRAKLVTMALSSSSSRQVFITVCAAPSSTHVRARKLGA